MKEKNIMKKTDEDYLTIVRMFTKRFDTDSPVTTEAIINEWHSLTSRWISDRKWRDIKDRYNDMYRNGDIDWYICGFSNGYVLTCDKETIKHDMRIKRRQALALLMRYSDNKTAMMLQHNFQADLED